MRILRSMLAPCRFAIVAMVAALAQAPAASAASIFVAKLNFSTESDALREAFEQFGAVSSANVITDSATGRSRGYGFVEMPDEQEARAAINALNETDFDGNTIIVKLAGPRESAGSGAARPAGGFGGGGGVRPAGGLDPKPPSPTPTPTPTPTISDVPAPADLAVDEAGNGEALDDAETDAELEAFDADAAEEAMDDREAQLDASEDFTDAEEESDSDASADVDAADGDESAEVDDGELDESLDSAEEADESGDDQG